MGRVPGVLCEFWRKYRIYRISVRRARCHDRSVMKEATMVHGRKFAASLALLLAMLVPMIASCNTTAGVGKDISGAGGALSGAAEDAKPSDSK